LSLKVPLIIKGIDAIAALKRASKGIGVHKSDIARYILDAVSRKYQMASCFIEPKRFDKGRWCNVEETFEETTEMTGTQAHSIRERFYGEVVV
jgi:hypothetical protein